MQVMKQISTFSHTSLPDPHWDKLISKVQGVHIFLTSCCYTSSYIFLWPPTWEPADLCVFLLSERHRLTAFLHNDGKMLYAGFDLRGARFSDETRLWIKALLKRLTLCLSKIKMILLDCRLSCFNDVTFYCSRGICSSVLTRKILGGTHLWTQYIIGLFHHTTHACTRILMRTHVCRYLGGYVSLGQIRILIWSGAA